MKYLVLLLILILILIGAILIYYLIKKTKESKDLKEKLADIKSADILREILEVSFDKESISKSSRKIVHILIKNFKIDYCTLFVNTGNWLKPCASNLNSRIIIKDLEIYSNDVISKLSEVGGKKLYSDNGFLSYNSAADRKINFSFFIPLKANNSLLGAVLIENTNYDDKNNDMGMEFFKVIMDTIAITFQNLLYYDKIVSMAIKDPLTNMFNRRHMEIVLREQISQGKLFSVAMMDIDHFKKFNDTYGHSFGDLVIITIAKYINNQVSSYGEVFRYGGEEFLILFKNMDSQQSFKKLDKIRQEISALQIINEKGTTATVTVSCGISEYTNNKAMESYDLKELADKALYYSKEHGRNQVTIYEEMRTLHKK